MNPVCDFNGQVALVTGAAKGMGLAIAQSCWPTSMLILLNTKPSGSSAKAEPRSARPAMLPTTRPPSAAAGRLAWLFPARS